VQFRTIQRADLIVAILIPPAVVAAIIGDKLPNLLITAAAVAAIRAVFLRSVLVALKAGQAQPPRGRRHLAPVHDLTAHRESRELVAPDLGVNDLN
jgi:hypothetical protein